METGNHPVADPDGTQELVDSATDGILGPNPFIGFRPEDIVAALQEFASQVGQHPAMVLEQQAAFLRECIGIMAGSSKLSPAPGDKRFADPVWQEIRSTEFICRSISRGQIRYFNS